MSLQTYIKNSFYGDVRALNTTRPNPTILTIDDRADNNTMFFGGQNWSNMDNDLLGIPIENRKYFCLCLFTMVAADENMFCHFRGYYNRFRKITNYPKFGWTGFGLHFEKPCILLSRASGEGVDFNAITDNEIKEFVVNQYRIANTYLGDEITVHQFFNTMLQDADFACDADIFQRLRNSMLENLPVT